MAAKKVLSDEYGAIHDANTILPSDKFKIKFPEALAESEDNNAHKDRKFPKTRLHKAVGVKQSIYRADIDKIPGWRIHVQYISGQLHLKDIVEGQAHDDVVKIIRSKKESYS